MREELEEREHVGAEPWRIRNVQLGHYL